jgi:deaminated glutathione amidase
MNEPFRVALAQHLSGGNVDRIVGEASAAGADIVMFPEMYSNGYAAFDATDPTARAHWCAQAEDPDGEFVAKFREAAKAHRVHVVATFLEKAEPKPFNAAVLVDPRGPPVAASPQGPYLRLRQPRTRVRARLGFHGMRHRD